MRRTALALFPILALACVARADTLTEPADGAPAVVVPGASGDAGASSQGAGSLSTPAVAYLISLIEGTAGTVPDAAPRTAPTPAAPSPATAPAPAPAPAGGPDALLYVQPVSHDHVRYDVAAGTIERLATSPTLDGIDELTLCSYYHYFAAQPVTGAVTAEVSHCELDGGDYWEQASVVVRDAGGAAREVFGVPGYAYGPPRVSFDGRLLAMRGRTPDERQGGSGDGRPGLFVMGVDGTLLTTLNTPTLDVRWLAGNRLLVVSPSGQGFRVSSPTVEGKVDQSYDIEQSIDPFPDRSGTVTSMDVGADSRQVVFGWRETVDAATVRDEIHALDLDTREVRLVASTPDYAPGDGVSGLIGTYGIRSVALSPSGEAAYVYMGGKTGLTAARLSGQLLRISMGMPAVVPIRAAPPPVARLPDQQSMVPTVESVPGLERLSHQSLYGLAGWPVTDYYPVTARGVR